ncbi:hypothetical protein EX30DRAFT_380749 [Ascodesmis nigricans]|uniref:Uncharacterized protein n=1 Tax=Ascodesmis nigricans TaxID=341454 RepID=A0A4S2N2X6_9PEZI|nr:hypothetical protein EX30DRAFT_380749 [Ascodesmis nigricans]
MQQTKLYMSHTEYPNPSNPSTGTSQSPFPTTLSPPLPAHYTIKPYSKPSVLPSPLNIHAFSPLIDTPIFFATSVSVADSRSTRLALIYRQLPLSHPTTESNAIASSKRSRPRLESSSDASIMLKPTGSPGSHLWAVLYTICHLLAMRERVMESARNRG